MRTHYENLKVGENATKEEIRSAYKSLAQKWHPDKNENKKLADRNFRVIKRSYDILSNAEKRAKHDAWIKKKRESEVYEVAVVGSPNNFVESDKKEDPVSFKDIVEGLGAKRMFLAFSGLCIILFCTAYNIMKAFEGYPVAIGVVVLLVAHLINVAFKILKQKKD